MTTLVPTQPTAQQIERFLDAVQPESLTGEDDHWFYTGPQYDSNKTRAPRIYFAGQVQTAARVAYVLNGGVIPTGELLRRQCAAYQCVRPSHHRVGAKPPVERVRPTDQERFDSNWAAVDRGFDTPCHIWQRNRRVAGYGVFRYHPADHPNGVNEYAHRVAWALAHRAADGNPGKLPRKGTNLRIGHVVCGIAGNTDQRLCVQPLHLALVSHGDALAASPNHFMSGNPEATRLIGKRRLDPTKCAKRLHPWVPENLLYYNGPTHPTCKACFKARQKKYDDARTKRRQEISAFIDMLDAKRKKTSAA